MTSATVSVQELWHGLQFYLNAVGDEDMEFIVTDRRAPVAKIAPITRESGLKALLREGTARAAATTRMDLPARISAAGTVSDLVADQRR